jgi:hypothetical protein
VRQTWAESRSTNLKVLGGSNPPLSATQSAISAFSAENQKMLRMFADTSCIAQSAQSTSASVFPVALSASHPGSPFDVGSITTPAKISAPDRCSLIAKKNG